MIVEIEKISGFYVVRYNGIIISRKKKLLQATKALAAYVKGSQ